ncbi:hypothetical protein GCM10007414_35780 [Agarivorans gilvus]|uniref:Uncharacterized protein n=1 Tax=Agarivorans gilvus TaxID=680279 RepID=A0ABQ1I5M5_9ALTE|nr:hypothetical protein GCM10007414_35780 [Agarivorans gilvus]
MLSRAINESCHKRYDGKKCKGVWGSALAPNDWKECSECNATGNNPNNSKFEMCDGFGWFYIRPSI